ncbi:hypothetical protein C1701_16320 [Actinoalloteichus sp. AHMU CJ021]|uniref:Uncharacterized protein n=1 Tax=Actinoalloteichus caeruleus DSM 43889 TaxID=1120930 RepID=A0ABT1JMR5_ACTCY|nr:hypothetical protein [Actinoalloteichus caeruleus]AUS79654.1 hypothetical protein C1701_16320 [Actinoalloteichus sp. AHMU CJ021]MCP2333807.1 hypothetical protein [Actinoalloteichus caeruleus DSM 43889]
MRHPARSGGEREPQRLLNLAAAELRRGLAPGWSSVQVLCRAAGQHAEWEVWVVMPDGTSHRVPPPEGLPPLLDRVRTTMYQPGTGTWVSGVLVLDQKAGSFEQRWEFDREPRWAIRPPPSVWLEELRRHPRDDERLPSWWRDHLARVQPTGTSPANQRPPTEVAAPPTPDRPDGVPRRGRARPGRDRRATAGPPTAPGTTPAATRAELRQARVFDGSDPDGRPRATREQVPPAERSPLLSYLENAPTVSAVATGPDELDPALPATVPHTLHSDGVWVWSGAVPYYLREHDVPPEPDLVAHVRSRRFRLPVPPAAELDPVPGSVEEHAEE